MPRDIQQSELYSIGQFSKLSNITIKTLRYYDTEGIFKPAHVDESNSYRYYTPTQLEHARLLQQLRFMHVPFDILRDFMQRPTFAYQQEVLDLYISRLEQEAETANGRIHIIQRRRTYPQDPRPYDVHIEVCPSTPFVYLHYEVGLLRIEEARDLAFREIRAYLATFGITPVGPPRCFGPPRAPARDDQAVGRVNAGFEVRELLPGEGRIRSGWTPGGTWYGARHYGLYDYLMYSKVPTFQRARENGISVGNGAGDFWRTEVYQIGPWDTPDLGKLVTDVKWLVLPTTLGSLHEGN